MTSVSLDVPALHQNSRSTSYHIPCSVKWLTPLKRVSGSNLSFSVLHSIPYHAADTIPARDERGVDVSKGGTP